MKKLEDYTDAEKIVMFDKLFEGCENAFNELCKPNNCDYFDTHAELEGIIETMLDTTQEDWDAKVEELSREPDTFDI